MKFLFRSGWGESLAIARRVEDEGHEVRMCICEEAKEARHVGDGLIDKTRDFPAAVRWVGDGVIVYDGNTFDMPSEAERLRRAGKNVIGSSQFGDELEHDRIKALELARKCGLTVPAYYEFKGSSAFDKARRFLDDDKDKKEGWVFKPNGDAGGIRTFVSKTVNEMYRMLDYMERRFKEEKEGPNFLLEERHKGLEVSTEAWFTGSEWCVPNGTLEKNRLMDGNLGEMTGCAGNVVWLYRSMDSPLIQRLIIPLTAILEGKYRGPVDVNSIIDEETKGPIFLEFTTRFGYSAIFALSELVEDMGGLLGSVGKGELYEGPLLHDRFAIGVRASIPPYPSISEGIAMDFPVFGFSCEGVDRGIHPCEVRLDENEEVETTGPDGVVFEFTASAPTIEEARYDVYEKISSIHVPNIRYRRDIGIEAERDFARLETMGLTDRPSKVMSFSKMVRRGSGGKSPFRVEV